MAKEIERKFLVAGDSWRNLADGGTEIVQGYLSTFPAPTVRVRIKGDKAFLTIKGANNGAVRDEWEYPVPLDDAHQMLRLCPPSQLIEKRRYIVGRWEIDVFGGHHSGLVLAEIELSSPDEPITLPPFIGREVTDDPHYYNSTLSAQV